MSHEFEAAFQRIGRIADARAKGECVFAVKQSAGYAIEFCHQSVVPGSKFCIAHQRPRKPRGRPPKVQP
jgi:hypothetical protein